MFNLSAYKDFDGKGQVEENKLKFNFKINELLSSVCF